ncbi:MAG: nucleotide exchange factor GrpE [Clostridiales bacterium]|nr:nucleotide exchange factor GrpE [Clostridiales bacterium]
MEEVNSENTGDNAQDSSTDEGNDERISGECCEQCCEYMEKIKELQLELEEEHDKYIRLAAEYDNYRKRTQKEKEALYTDVKGETIAQLLPVYDNLERALAQNCSDEAFYKGIEMTMAQLMEIFTKLGLSAIPALGEKFDASVHNAVMQVEDTDAEENTVVEELQKGFKLGDKVIRYSMVTVAK